MEKMIIQYPETFNPFKSYNIKTDSDKFYLCELLMNKFQIMSDVLLFDNVDTPQKTWNPFSRINGKFVDAFYSRKKRTINYEIFKQWEMDDEHGMIHAFFVAFWATYILNKHHKRDLIDLFYTTDDYFVDVFYSALVHDFYRLFNEDEKKHAKQLKDVFPNCIEETYRHSSPLKKDFTNPLIVADRIELFRIGENYVNEKVFKDILTEQELIIIKFFYKHFRPKLQNLWVNRHEPFITHYVEDHENWDFKAKTYPYQSRKDVPTNVSCVFVRPNIYTLEEINNRFFFFGVLPIKDVESLPIKFCNEHPTLKADMMNEIHDWSFMYNIPNFFQKEMVNNKIYPIRHDILVRFMYLVDQLYATIMLNTFYEKK